jgi:phosphoglycerate dehydrogenase-like enzyme
VNVGRGELIDEAALIHALRDGRVAMAALDVFNIEPLPDHSPLWTMPNVIVTPHSAGTTAMSRARATEMFTTNLVRYLSGEPLINEVN